MPDPEKADSEAMAPPPQDVPAGSASRATKSASHRLLPAIVLTLCIVLSIVVVAVLFSRHANGEMLKLYQENQHLTAFHQARHVGQGIDLLVVQLESLNLALTDDGVLSDEALATQLAAFHRQHQPGIAAVGYMDTQGVLQQYAGGDDPQAKADISFMPHVKRALSTQGIVVSDGIVASDGQYGIAIHVPLVVGGQFRGDIVITIHAEDLGLWMPQATDNPHTFTLVLDASEHVVYHPNSQFLGESIHATPRPILNGAILAEGALRDGRTGIIEGRVFGGKPHVLGVAAATFHGTRFLFLSSASYDVIAAPALRFSRYTSILTGLTFLVTALGFVYAFYLFRTSKNAWTRKSDELHQDIRRREHSEVEHEQLIEQLGMKNAELERFAYTVSHDLKSPLITIRGFLGMLEKDIAEGDTDRTKADMARIANAAENMQRLLDELLELSRIGRLENPLEDVNVADATNEVLELLAGRMQDRDIAVDISPDLPVIHVDRPRFLEVMQNLLENAIKFMGDQAEPRIEVGTREGGRGRVIFVKDNGIGLDMEYADRVFQLFEQLDPSFEGTGMGLAMVKRILEHAGSRIWAESEGPGEGTAFCFTVPTPTDEEDRDGPASRRPQAL